MYVVHANNIMYMYIIMYNVYTFEDVCFVPFDGCQSCVCVCVCVCVWMCVCVKPNIPTFSLWAH